MAVERLTYAALAERLGISPEAARGLARRHRWPRELGSDGKAVVAVDLATVEHRPLASRSVGQDVAVLQVKIEMLEAELGRERKRSERLLAELLKASRKGR